VLFIFSESFLSKLYDSVSGNDNYLSILIKIIVLFLFCDI